MKKDKIIKMVEVEFELDDKIIDFVVKFALDKIWNDRQALINYGVNEILKEIIKNPKMLKEKK